MWPLSGPTALKPSLVGVGLSACAPPSSCTPSRTRTRNSLSLPRRVSVDVCRVSLDGRRSSLSPAAAAPATALASSPSADLLDPFGLNWEFPTATLGAHAADTQPVSDEASSLTSARSGIAAAVSSAAAALVAPQQVTRHNFAQALPLVTQALEDCTFFALDCEFTGLSPQAPHFSELYDDAADRYQRVLSASQQFAVMQLGLSMYQRDPETGDYTARTFNFSVFPKPSGPNDRRFLCQASSLEFLASQGFDFNRWVYDGIPYMQLAARDRQLVEMAQAGVAATSPSDFAVTGGFSQVLEIMRRCGKPVVLHNGLADLVYSLQQFACPLPDSWDDFKPLALSWFSGGIYDTRVLASSVMGEAHMPGLFTDLTLSKVHAALAPGGSADEALRSAATSSNTLLVEPSASSCQLPVIAHADGYTLYPEGSSGASSPAPPSTSDASLHGVAAVEPACLMSSAAPSSLGSSASSPSCFGRPAAPAHEAGFDAYLTGAVFARLARAAEILLPHGPVSSSSSSHSQEFDDQASVGSASSLSDIAAPCTPCPGSPQTTSSPLDSLLSATSSDDDASSTHSGVGASPLSALAAVEAWRGRLHSMRADVPYLYLHGTDPRPHRPHVFFLSNLPLHTKVSTVATKFAEAGLGKVRVVMMGPPSADTTMTASSYNSGAAPVPMTRTVTTAPAAAVSSKSAFVQLLQTELADQVLPAVKSMGVPWRAVSYAEYHTAKQRSSAHAGAYHQTSSTGNTITVQAVAQHHHHQPQPKYKLVRVPEEESQQQTVTAVKARQAPIAVSKGAGDASKAAQGSTRQRLMPTTTTSAPADGSAAPKRYITVVRKIASSVLSPVQQAQQQQQQQVQQPAAQATAAEGADPAAVLAAAAEEQSAVPLPPVPALCKAAAAVVQTAAAMVASAVPPPPPPPPRTPARACDASSMPALAMA